MCDNIAYPVVGFLGTGAITSAVVTGFCERAKQVPFPIVLSPRSQATSDRLRKAYPERVQVAKDMQDVLDRAEWVVLAVPPDVGEKVCRSLRFRPDHKVISFLPDQPLPVLRKWIGSTEVLVHMVPLTFHAICDGPILLYPPNAEASALFGQIGRMIEVEHADQASALSAITACVTPLFAVMDTLVQWLEGKNVPSDQAADYVSSFLGAVCQEAAGLSRNDMHRMARESTPGGINLMAKDILENAGGFSAWQKTMERILKRVTETLTP